MNEYYLYWVHRQDHTNIDTEGYVGITRNFQDRMNDHKNNKRRNHFGNAVAKYGWDNLVKEIILEGLTQEEALEFENMLRPSEQIGWNDQRGGYLGVNPEWYDVEENKIAHQKSTSVATKLAIAEKDSTEARAERARQNWIVNAESYKGVSVGSKNPRALLDEDKVWDIRFSGKYDGMSNVEVAKIFNVKKYVIWAIRIGKNWKHVQYMR